MRMTWTALVALCLAVWVVQASVIKRQAATPSEIVFNETDRPKGLKVVFATEQSLRLVWTFDTSSWKKVPDPGPQEELSAPLGNSTTEKPFGEEEEIEAEEEEENEDVTLDGYRIFYEHGSYEDVKTLKTQLESFRYELKGLEPFSTYKIYVRALVNGQESPDSDHISATTDVSQPSKPWITNLTCFDTGSLYVQWRRPELYHKGVDFYKVYYKQSIMPLFESITMQASEKTEEQKFFLDNLSGNAEYVLKICAGTTSQVDSSVIRWGDPSPERRVYLPQSNCKILYPGLDNDGEGVAELSVGMIIGAMCAIGFLVLACVGFVVWRHHRKSDYWPVEPPEHPPPPTGIPDWENAPGSDGKSCGNIKIADFSAHVQAQHADTDIGFAKEYEEIRKYSESLNVTNDQCQHPDNKHKNRYLNIMAYDHSRVQLSQLAGQKRTSDYINANYINGFEKYHAYIGTQGPLEETCEAFWRMIWEQNVYVLVMITNLMERGRRKCDMYWPKELDTSTTYGFIEVFLEKEEVMANYTVRSMRIKHLKLKRKKGSPGERVLKQFHYTSWPDHGVPAHPLPVLSFIKKSADANPEGEPGVGGGGGPIVTHCSAGVGRTGTYIVIDTMLRQMRKKGEMNIFGFLKHIRSQRNYLVQTEEQYIFIHDALLEATKTGGFTEVEDVKLKDYLEKLLAPVSEEELFGKLIALHNHVEDKEEEGEDKNSRKEQTLLERQFELITSFSPPLTDFHYLSAKKPVNAPKNSDPCLLPIESARVALAPKPGIEGSDYINATWLHGHNELKEFVITQHPRGEEDRGAFWRMLWDHNAQTIVLLTELGKEGLPIFWPLLEDEFDFSTFRVRYIEKATHEGHSTFDFVLSSCQDDYELTVRIIHCSEWPHNVQEMAQTFEVLKLVQQWHLEYQKGPLVVVDRHGGTEAATFCALTTLCNQLETDSGIDVYQVAKLFHNKRPGIWKSEQDILFLYKAMHALITSNTLANPMTADVTMTTPTSANHVESSPPTTVTCIKPDEDTVGGCSGGGDKDKHVRRHSASSIGVATGGDVGSVAPSASSRRHSLPPSSGSAGGDSERSSQRGEEDEEEEETEEEEEEKQKLIKPDPVGASDVILPSPVSATTHAQNGGLVVKTAPPSLESNGSAGGAAGLGHLKNGDAEPVTA